VHPGSEAREPVIPLRAGAGLTLRYGGPSARLVLEVLERDVVIDSHELWRGAELRVVLPAGDYVARLVAWSREGRVVEAERPLRLVVGEERELVWPARATQAEERE
jgi:hypothetical protein